MFTYTQFMRVAHTHTCAPIQTNTSKGYECTNNEGGIEHMVLEGEKCQAHVREDKVFSQEIQQLKQLFGETEDNSISILYKSVKHEK